MAYKRYFYKNGKKLGPYYYESYRDKTGKVKKRYVGTLDPDKKQVTPTKKIFILLLIFGVFALLIGASFFYLEKQNQENKNSSFSGFFKKIIGFVTLEDDAPSSESEATSETGTASETTQETTSETTQETPSQETTEVVPEEIDSGEVTSEPAQTTDSTSETLQEETTPASETTQEETSESTEQTEASQENTTQETEEIAETEPEINQTQETNQTIEPEINQTISEINETQETGVNETISETDNSSELNQTTEGEETNQTTEIIIPLINESILNESFLNETLLNESLLNQTLLNETLLNETLLNETLLNQTLLNESELNISIIQYSAVINRPVKWIKTLNIENIGNLTNLSLEIPLEAQNITIKTDEEVSKALEDAKEFEKQVKELAKEEYRQEKDLEKSGRGITGQVFYDTSSKKGILTRFFEWLTHFTISGRVIDEQEVQENIIETEDNKIVDLGSIAESAKKEVAVEYYTPAPSAYEENFSLGKKVTVYSIGEMNYTNILAYSSLDNRISIEQNNIRVIWKNENKEINFSSYDLDSDGFIDYIEWNVEHLSNQTYEIIYITKAERLDENRVFIEDIYEQVKEKDDNWTIINNSQYVRVTFEIPLDNTRDITIYARGLNSNSTNESQTSEIEVYEQNSSELITTFENISEEVWYKVYLTNMSENETQETFDLRFIGDVEVDYIVDPTINFSVGVPGLGINYYTNGSVLNVSVLAYANSPKNVSSFIDFDHSLVSWWRMDDNLSGVLIDYMGYHNGSVLNNAVQNTSGRLGDSFSFDGVDDAINLTQGLSSKDYPSGNESRTIAYWFMAGGFATTAFNATFGFWDNASANGKIFQSGVEDNAVCLVMGGHRVITPKNALLVNTWYHVAIVVPEGASDTYDPLIYINGTNQVLSDEACSGCPHVLNTSIFTSLIGNIYSLGNDFNGSIDDVMVFNRSFSAEEIQALYAITSNRSFVGSYNLSLERNYTFEVYAQDSSGEVNTSGELNVLRDFGNPSVEINSPINLNYASGNINFNVTSSESGVGSIVPNLDSSLVSWWRMDDIASGSELVTEGDFSNNGAAWTSTSGWDFSAGNANSDGGDSLSQDLDIIAGVQYNVTYEIIDYTSGYAQVALGTMPAVTAASAVGVYSEIITPIDNSGISFNLNLGPDLTIDNVSVKRVNAGIVDYMGINNGTIVNETTLTDAGAFGKGIRFDGVNDYIVLGDTASLKVPTKTINFWANPTINSQCTASLCILFSSGNGQYYIGIRNNTDSSYYLYLAFVNSTGSQKAPASPAYSVKINEWHMYTVMFNVTGNIVNVSYYRDGVFIETDTFNEGHYASYGNNFVIGALSSNSAYDYNGSLDDISFFNRTLSSDEVFALYNATAIYHNRIIPDGSRSYTAYVQDKYGRVAEDSVSFNVDTSYPTQIINSPANTTYTSVNITFNATSSESSSGSLISDLNKSLVTWWRMDETNSSGDIIDYFGLNNASALGDSMQTDEGYFGKGFRFDGTGDYSVVGDKANLELVNGTISLWVYPVGYRDAGGFVSKSIGGGVGSMVWTAGFEYTASTPSGKPRFYLGNGTAILGLTMLSSIPLNTWSNMVFWWNGSYMSIYYNGVLNRTQAQTLQVNTTNTFPVEIGRQFAGANFLFNGTIDDIMIFNRPLTADEIVALYNATAIKHNKTLSEAGYNYTIYSQDRAGNLNSSSVSFGIESTSLTSPRELTQPNTVYVLQNDLTGLSDTVTVCFDVLADNITIDGNGKTINSGGYGLGYYGVQVNGRKNITIKNFKNISGFESGIYLYSSNDSVISNISSYSNYYGMDVSSNSNNNVFTNVNLNLNTYGVNLYSNTKNNFTNITSNSNSDYGVYLQDSTYNVFDNLTANSNSNNGIYLYNSSFNALKRIVANSNIYGMSAIFGSNNNTIMNLTTNLNSNYGTIISASRNNLINNLTSNSNLLYGVYINASLNNTIGNFSVWNSSAIGTYAGLYVYESSNNSFIRGNINLSSEYGIWVYSSGTGASDTSFSNRFYDVNIFNVLNYGVYLDTTSNSVNQYNNFTNMYIYNSTPHAVYLESLNHVNLFKNITINITTGAGINITLSLGNHIINNSFYNVNGTSYYLFNSTINEYSLRNNSLDIVNTLYGGIKFLNNSLYASGTNMSKSIWLSTNKVSVNSTLDNGFNTTANITIKGLSLTRPKAVVDYNSDGTFEECTVASGCNNLSYSSGVFVFNVTHFTDYRAGEYTEVLSCRELDLPNMTYVLNASAVTTGTCFTITADNITFDGQGNTVDGDDSGSDYGIYAQGRRNITIKNFKNITDFDTGIYFGNTNDSWIYNLSAQSGSIGLTLSYCFDVNVSDVSARLSGDKGIYIQESAYNRFTNVSSSSSTSYEFVFYNGDANNLSAINATSSAGGLYFVSESDNNIISNSYISPTSTIDAIASSVNNILLNVSYNYSKESIDTSCSLTRKWYYTAYVNDTAGVNVNNANITAYNRTGSYMFNLTTGTNGLTTQSAEIIDHINNGTRVFYSPYNVYAINTSYTATSASWNATLKQNTIQNFTLNADSVAPGISITSPLNSTNSSNVGLDVNYTVSGTPANCWYSNDSKSVNVTLASCANITTVTWSNGPHNVTIYTNDSAGNLNSSAVRFTIDSVLPTQIINSPTSKDYSSANINFNATSSESGVGSLVSNFDRSVVSWWRMDDLNASGDVVDYNKRNNLSVFGNAIDTDAGAFGRSFSFDGAGDYLMAANSLDHNFTNKNITVSAWIYPLTFNYGADTSGYIIESGQVYWVMNLANSTGYLTFSANFLTDTAIVCSNAPNLNEWSHVVATYNGTAYALYENGVLQCVDDTSGSIGYNTAGYVSIGRHATSNIRAFNGSIDDVILFNKSLSYDEIVALYNASAIYHNKDLLDRSYNYTVYSQDKAGNVNISSVSFTIDLTTPGITILTPANGTNSSNSGLDVNYTVSGTPANCWYANDSRSVNVTLASCANITAVVWSEGQHNVTVYVNDSAGNLNSSSVSFKTESGSSVTFCRDLDVANRVYTLQNNIGTTETCFNVTADNVTINGNGFIILGDHGDYGVYAQGRRNISVINFKGINNFNTGVYFYFTNNSRILNLTNSSNNNGILLESAYNNILTNVISNNNSGVAGIILQSSINNTLVNITATLNLESAGIYLSLSSGNFLNNLNVSLNNRSGIYLDTSLDNYFANITAISNAVYGLNINSSSDNNFTNLNISTSGVSDVYLEAASNNVILLNSSYGSETLSDPLSNNPSLIRKWYYNAYVNDTAGVNVNNANITAYNRTGSYMFNLTTGTNGLTSQNAEIIDYYAVYEFGSTTTTYYSPYNIYARNSSYPVISASWNATLKQNTRQNFTLDNVAPGINITSPVNSQKSSNSGLDVNYTVSGNPANCWYTNDTKSVNVTLASCANITTVIWSDGLHDVIVYANDSFGNLNSSSVSFYIEAGSNVTFCRDLSIANMVYNLDEEIINSSINGDICFEITGENITLNCNGYYIDLVGSNNYNVLSSYMKNTTIRNCYIYADEEISGYAFQLNGNNSYFYNNSVYFSGRNDPDQALYSTGSYINVINNSINEAYTGLRISGYNNNITGNFLNITGVGETSYGIHLSGNNNTVKNNSVLFQGDYGIYLTAANLNYFYNNYVRGNPFDGAYSLLNSENNTFILDSVDVVLGGGYYMSGSNHNLIKDTRSLTVSTGEFILVSNSVNNTALNVTYNEEIGDSVAVGSELIRKWYYTAYVNDTAGVNVNNANITAYNRTGSYMFNLTTGTNGLTPQSAEIIDYVNNGTRTFYSPYNIYARNSSYPVINVSWNATLKQNTRQNFTLDNVAPGITIITPVNGTNSTDNLLDVNYTVSGTPANCWYSNDSRSVNVTLASCANITSVVWSDGPHNVTVYVNDSAGNLNSSAVSFKTESGSSVTFCRDLDVANRVYTLQNDILDYPGGCFRITADNITFDGNGKILKGDGSLDESGIFVFPLKNITIKNFKNISEFYYGINFYKTNSSFVYNLTLSNDSYGLYFDTSRHNLVNNLNFSLNNEVGGGSIYLLTSKYNNISQIKSYRSYYGIYDMEGESNNLSVINLLNVSRGIIINGTVGSSLSDIIIGFQGHFGIVLESSYSASLNKVNVSESQYAINIYSGSGHNLSNINAWFNTYYDLQLDQTNSNILTNFNVNDSAWVIFQSSYENNIFNSTFNLTGETGSYFTLSSNSLNNIFLNSTYNTTAESVDVSSSLIRKWYYTAYVNDTRGVNVNNANITAYNRTGSYMFNLTTGTNGITSTTAEIIDYVNNGTRTFYSPYNIYARNSSYPVINVSWNVTLKQNDRQNFTLDNAPPGVRITTPANNTNTSDTLLDVNYTVSSDVANCWYANDSRSVNVTLASCANITAVVWSEGEHNVTVYVNDTLGNLNSSAVRFTIDTISPGINITTPLNNTNTSNTGLDVNYTVSGAPANCWYANDSRSVNVTLVGCANITSVVWSEGQHNVTVYVNDSVGNLNSSAVRFTIDTISPGINITTPINNTYSNNINLDVNYTISGGALNCWYANDSRSVNVTLAGCANITSVVWSEGQHNVTVYANDSAGNLNSSAVRFTIDTGAPGINITTPINNTNSSNNALDVNYTVSGTPANCWYANDTKSVNVTLAGCANITSVVWSDGPHNVTVYVNDSSGNLNSSAVRFYIETGSSVTFCRDLGTANSIYTVQNNIGTTETCFNILADNITLNGNGFVIDGDDSGTDYGVYAQGRRNITIKNFKNITDFNDGIYFGNTNDSWIYNLSAQSGSIGLTLSYCFDVNVSDVSARLSGDKGIYIQESAYNRFTNVSSSSSTSYEFVFYNGDANNLSAINATSSAGGLYFVSESDNNIISNSYISPTSTIDAIASSVNNILLNVSYNYSKESIDTSCSLTRKWYYTAYVNDTRGVNVNNANITAYNNTGSYMFNLTTGTNGLTPQSAEIIDHINNGTRVFYSPYTVYAINTSYTATSASWNATLKQNVQQNFTLSLSTSVVSCGTLDLANSVYTLQNDLTGVSGTCFNINADNITLNGNGFVIDGDDSGTDYGVYALGRRNITIKNFKNITDFDTGIYFGYTNLSFISNLSTDSNTYGVYLMTSFSNNLANLTSKANANMGISLWTFSNNNNMVNITTNYNVYGLYLSANSNNTLVNNITANSNRNNGIYLSSVYGTSFRGFEVWNSSTGGSYSGIYVYESSNNSFVSGYVNNSGNRGVYVYSVGGPVASNNLFKDLWIGNTSSEDVYVEADDAGSGAMNNTFLNATYSDFDVANKTSDGGNVEIIKVWYYTAYVNDTAGVNVNNANITAYNRTGSYRFNLTTGTNGFSPSAHIIDYINNGTRTYYSNYTVYAINTSYFANNHPWNSSIGNGIDYITLANHVSPIIGTFTINSTDGTNKTLTNINCFANITEAEGDKMNVSVKWYKNKALNLSLDYNNNYANNSRFIAMLDDANTTRGENWTCSIRLFDGLLYSNWTNSSNLTILNTLPIVSLSSPANNNVTTNRTPLFSWAGSDDDVTDVLSYEINISLVGAGLCTDTIRYVNNNTLTSSTSYRVTPYLKCLIDNNDFYNWTARAYDGEAYGAWAVQRNISIAAYVAYELNVSSVLFGKMNISDTKNTTLEDPKPFVVVNTGNVYLNISANFSDIFFKAPNPSDSYQFKIRNTSASCFDRIATRINWTNATTTNIEAINRLNFTGGYQTGCSNASIDILVRVPSDETPGNRSSSVVVLYTSFVDG